MSILPFLCVCEKLHGFLTHFNLEVVYLFLVLCNYLRKIVLVVHEGSNFPGSKEKSIQKHIWKSSRIKKQMLFFTRQQYKHLFRNDAPFFDMSSRSLGPVYTERQRQSCDVPSNITLINLFRFINEPSESFQKWVAPPTDQALTLMLQINH